MGGGGGNAWQACRTEARRVHVREEEDTGGKERQVRTKGKEDEQHSLHTGQQVHIDLKRRQTLPLVINNTQLYIFPISETYI